jgi:signal transduction histidine kinase
MPDRPAPQLSDLEAALKLFDETTGALAARIQRLEEVLVLKQQELLAANRALGDKVSELDRVTAWLNLVMSAVASGVVAVDRAGRITTCNDAARAALAGCLASPLGADYRAAFPDSPLLRVLDGTVPAAAYERIVSGPDGARCILAAKASPLRGSDGAMLGAVEVFEDVTEMRRLRESVERADRLKQLGEMAAGVAHEIRNPLNGIEGFASLLTRDLPADDQRHRYATHIVEGVRNLNRTVSVLLDFTRERRLERRPVPPVDLAHDCLELVRAELALRPAEDGPTVALDLVDRWGGARIDVDGGQLKQVLLNLVQNAVHAVDDGDRPEPCVTLTVEPVADPAGVAFVVDDNGPGVPAEIRQRIFTPFYTTKDHGTGLGLAVAHAIVQLHGGGIAVEDSPLGGARFRVTLPTA